MNETNIIKKRRNAYVDYPDIKIAIEIAERMSSNAIKKAIHECIITNNFDNFPDDVNSDMSLDDISLYDADEDKKIQKKIKKYFYCCF